MLQNYSFPPKHESDMADSQDIADHKAGKHRDWLIVAVHVLTRSRIDFRESKPLERPNCASY